MGKQLSYIMGWLYQFLMVLPFLRPLTLGHPLPTAPSVSVELKFHSGSFDIHIGGVISTFYGFPIIAPP